MTYEQASARGLRYRREDGAVLSYRDGVLHHFTAAITTAETAAKNRAAILRDFYEYRRSAVSEGETGPVREYLLVPGADPSRAERLARLLATQGIEVSRAGEPFRLGTRTLPGRHVGRAGGAAVRAPGAQPARSRRSCSPRRSSRSRTAAAGSGSAIRSTTSPRGACRWPSTSRS